MVESVLTGGTEPEGISRPKIARLLRGKPGLAARLEKAKQERDGRVVFDVEPVRVRHVLVKLARGHAAFEMSLSLMSLPAFCSGRLRT
jgi:hypothetical protein